MRSQFGETSEAIFLTSGFVYDSAEQAKACFKGENDHFIYSRYSNPSVSMFEERLRLLEGTKFCQATASGMGAVFEATHGTAPKYANLDKVNPGSVILSGEMMFRYMGWAEAADLIITSLEKTIADKTVTYDLARMIPGSKELKCSEFGDAMIANM